MTDPTPFTYCRNPGLPRGFSFAHDPLVPSILIRPLGLLSGAAAAGAVESGAAVTLAGGPLAFDACEAYLAGTDGSVTVVTTTPDGLRAWGAAEGGATERVVNDALDGVARPRAPIAGLELSQPLIMGVVNVTPDSFHAASQKPDIQTAIDHGRALAAAGADIVDVGGESTRPGAAPTDAALERQRALPVVEALAADGIVVSIDTRRAGVMRDAVAAGARIINDVSALEDDPDAVAVAADTGAAVVLMHRQGVSATMQEAPVYGDAAYEVTRYLASRVAACEAAGLPRDRIAVDPGIGFGKTVRHNAELINRLAMLHSIGCAVLLGASRKGFIGRLDRQADTDARLPGSVAAIVAGVERGANIFRVHDVAETRQAFAVASAILNAG